MTFGAKQISNERKTHGGSGFAPLLAGLALPISVASMFVVGSALNAPTPIIASGIVAFVVIYAVAYLLAGGTSPLRAIATPVIVLILGAMLMAGELFAVIYTGGVAWLVIVPFGIWAAYQVADSLTPASSPGSQPLAGHPGDGWSPYSHGQPMTPPSPPTPPVTPPLAPRPPDLDFWQPPSQQEDDPPSQGPFS